MREFKDRLKLTPSQRIEVERYLNSVGVLNEFNILQICRKMKKIEQKLEEMKYDKPKNSHF